MTILYVIFISYFSLQWPPPNLCLFFSELTGTKTTYTWVWSHPLEHGLLTREHRPKGIWLPVLDGHQEPIASQLAVVSWSLSPFVLNDLVMSRSSSDRLSCCEFISLAILHVHRMPFGIIALKPLAPLPDSPCTLLRKYAMQISV